MAERHVEKTCADCKCRNCDPITSMAERVDAYMSAKAQLADMKMPDDMYVTPHEVLVLANWLYYGGGNGDDDD